MIDTEDKMEEVLKSIDTIKKMVDLIKDIPVMTEEDVERAISEIRLMTKEELSKTDLPYPPEDGYESDNKVEERNEAEEAHVNASTA